MSVLTFRRTNMVVYTLGNGLRSTYRRCRFWQKKKKHLFRWSSFWSWHICKQAKLSNWATENPHAYIEKPRHPKRVTIWWGFWSRSIIRQYFFKNEQGEAVTVNGDRYPAMLNEFLFTNIEEEDIGNIWFQQGGAKCHTRWFAPCFWTSHYQPRFATSELRFDTVGLLVVRCRQR